MPCAADPSVREGTAMTGLAGRLMGRLIASNNRHAAWVDSVSRNPRRLDGCAWHTELRTHVPELRAEWDDFVAAGGQLPHIEDVLGEDQGNIGAWRVGVLRVDGTSTRLACTAFPQTSALLDCIPGLRAALWSVLEPGTELTEHCGPNAGVLRYHLGIDCDPGSELRVGAMTVGYATGEGILFDDSAPHAAWNHSARDRVTLFCEVERPLPPVGAARNRLVQWLVARDPRRRGIVALADEWQQVLQRTGWPTSA